MEFLAPAGLLLKRRWVGIHMLRHSAHAGAAKVAVARSQDKLVTEISVKSGVVSKISILKTITIKLHLGKLFHHERTPSVLQSPDQHFDAVNVFTSFGGLPPFP